MLKKVQGQLEKLGVQKDSKLLLAVSGGRDSMCMLFVLQKLGYSIQVAHCNYKLRDKASDQDAELVESYCQKHAIPFHHKVCDTRTLADQNGWSIQQAAREIRYDFFEALIEKERLDYICTAHHRNDDFETSIMALVNANFYKGIAGIPPKRDHVIRPLIGVSRFEIDEFVDEFGVQFREDASNKSNKYKRNFTRHEIVPRMEEMNPHVLDTFQKFKSQSELAFSFLEYQFQKWSYSNKKRIPLDVCSGDQQWLLWMWWKNNGGNWSQFEELQNAIGKSGLKWECANGDFMLGSTYILFQEHTYKTPSIEEVVSIQKNRKYSFSEIKKASSEVVYLNAEKIQGKLRIGFWKEGMRFHPFGMKGSKLVSDFFTDEKVDFGLRNQIPILSDDYGIVWIIGYRIDNRFRVDDATKEIWKIIKK